MALQGLAEDSQLFRSLPKSCLDIPSGPGFTALSSVILSLTLSKEEPKKTFCFPDLGSSCGMGNTFAEGRAAEHGVGTGVEVGGGTRIHGPGASKSPLVCLKTLCCH